MVGLPAVPTEGAQLDRLDRFTKLNVVWLLGQTLREAQEGNDKRAILYLATTLVAFKYKKASLVFQGVLTADRTIGRVTGVRPVKGVLPITDR